MRTILEQYGSLIVEIIGGLGIFGCIAAIYPKIQEEMIIIVKALV